jgi:hypothetical protein
MKKIVVQMLCMRKESDASPWPQMRTILSVQLHGFIRQVTINEVANCLQISHSSCARWVPEQSTVLHKHMRLDICQQHLDRYAFLDRMITGDETWSHHCEPESKWQSMEWKHRQSPSKKKKFKSQPSTGKLTHTDFFGFTRPRTGILSGEGKNNKRCSIQ